MKTLSIKLEVIQGLELMSIQQLTIILTSVLPKILVLLLETIPRVTATRIQMQQEKTRRIFVQITNLSTKLTPRRSCVTIRFYIRGLQIVMRHLNFNNSCSNR